MNGGAATIRIRLLVAASVLIALVLAGLGVYLEHELREGLEARIERDLTRQAYAARDHLEDRAAPLSPDAIDVFADKLGRSIDARVTVIAADGTVVGDSELPLAKLSATENHGGRPEVVQARDDGLGISRRHSQTLETEMLYAAVPFSDERGGGIVRIATPLSEVQAAISTLRQLLLAVGAMALLGGVAITAFALSQVARQLRSLLETAARPGRRPVMADSPTKSLDAFDGIEGSFRSLTAELEATLVTLGRERDRFEAVLESMEHGVIGLGPNREITQVNAAAERLLSLPPEVVGAPLGSVIELPELTPLLDEAGGGHAGTVEFDLPQRGRRLLARCTPIADREGVVLVFQDVSELRRLERIRQDFVANVSHELRTPVSIIRANAETLLDGAMASPAQAERFLSAILRHAERLGRVITDLLDISRIEAGKYRVELGPVSLAEVATHIIESAVSEAEKKGIELGDEVDPDLWVTADNKALDHVIQNLVDNALKYTPTGGHVGVRAEVGPETVRIVVEDDGPGIDEEHRSRIFERFYRVDPGRSRDMGGTGLGLAIVKHLVDAMQGRVGLEPRQPNGCRFWVELARTTPML